MSLTAYEHLVVEALRQPGSHTKRLALASYNLRHYGEYAWNYCLTRAGALTLCDPTGYWWLNGSHALYWYVSPQRFKHVVCGLEGLAPRLVRCRGCQREPGTGVYETGQGWICFNCKTRGQSLGQILATGPQSWAVQVVEEYMP